jgi:hypothetical protein
LAASFADNETWHVMIADDMKRMNVEQLDDAFRLSLVDASTLVWKDGMKTWQRLGAVAGLDADDDDDDGPDSVTRLMVVAPPPPPRPLARPAPKPPSPRRVPPAPRAAPGPRAVAAAAWAAPNPFLSTVPPAAPPPPQLLAPVFTPSVTAPAPVSWAPRATVPSEVNFRRKPGGVRWGRWLALGLLVTGGVLGAYRQNWLREGARRIGVEGKYLYGERRVTAFVSANAPLAVTQALGKLSLLPGPNAEPPVVTPPPRAPAPVTATVAAPVPDRAEDQPKVEAVAVDALPPLAPQESVAASAPPPAKAAPAATPPRRASASSTRALAKAAKPTAEPKLKAEPKPKAPPKPRAPAPVAGDNPLKAAIRSAIAADSGK